jgi:transposase
MTTTVLGIDISKKKFHVALMPENGKTVPKVFPNDTVGFHELGAWLARHHVTKVHACMEATSTYGEALAEFLYEAGHLVSIVNPARIKGFAKGELLRTKTDKVDAALIARFCAAIKPEIWVPLSPEVKHLQALLRRLESLTEMQQQEQNRLETAAEPIVESIKCHLEYLQQSIEQTKQLIDDHFDQHPSLKAQRHLPTTIPGIGEQSAAMLLGEMGNLQTYENARQLAAFAGLTPVERSSGSSVHGKPRLSRMGNARLRHGLYWPAIVAMQHNPLLKAFSERLLARGKAKMQVIGAVMRKLLHQVFGILKSQKPFDPNFLSTTP